MNTPYDRFPPDRVEKYFQRALFYGMYPSMFSHNASQDPYWRAPRWYNRDRPLFKRYIPLIKRIAEAGWQPIPHAASDDPLIYLERFGPDAGGDVYLTLFNGSDAPREARVQVDVKPLGLAAPEAVEDLLGGDRMPARRTDHGLALAVRLDPERVRVLRLPGGK